MYDALVYYLPFNVPALDAFRARYDPRFEVAPPHLTLVFPFQGVDEGALRDHIRRVTASWPAFEVRFRGVTVSWDDFVLLLVEEGREAVIGLHDALYSVGFALRAETGVLAPFLRHDLPFEPHLTLGRSVTDETLREAERLNLDVRATLDRLHLIRRAHEAAEAEVVEVFRLATRG